MTNSKGEPIQETREVIVTLKRIVHNKRIYVQDNDLSPQISFFEHAKFSFFRKNNKKEKNTYLIGIK